MTGVEFHTYTNRQDQAEKLANLVAVQLRERLKAKSTATLAVPGGSTPAAFLEALSSEPLDWSRVTVLPTDERVVPDGDERSNMRLIRGTLLQNHASTAHAFPLVRWPHKDWPLDQVDTALAQNLPIDVCVLGMGDDMHTASLFPGADRLVAALDVENNAALINLSAPNAPEPRVSLTATALRASAHLHLLIAGQAKSEALRRAQAGNDWSEAPVRCVLSAPSGLTIHYAD